MDQPLFGVEYIHIPDVNLDLFVTVAVFLHRLVQTGGFCQHTEPTHSTPPPRHLKMTFV